MAKSFPLRFFYYVNNIAFSYLLFVSLFIVVRLLLVLTQKSEMPAETLINVHDIRSYVTVILIAAALYQSFLALYSIKSDIYKPTYWTRKMITCGAISETVSCFNLIDITNRETPPLIALFYKTHGQIIGITGTGVFFFVMALFFFYISKFWYKGNYTI